MEAAHITILLVHRLQYIYIFTLSLPSWKAFYHFDWWLVTFGYHLSGDHNRGGGWRTHNCQSYHYWPSVFYQHWLTTRHACSPPAWPLSCRQDAGCQVSGFCPLALPTAWRDERILPKTWPEKQKKKVKLNWI